MPSTTGWHIVRKKLFKLGVGSQELGVFFYHGDTPDSTDSYRYRESTEKDTELGVRSQKSEDGRQKAEDRSRKSEVGSRKAGVGSWESGVGMEVGSRKKEVRSQKSEVGRRKTEDGRRKTEVGSRKVEGRSQKLHTDGHDAVRIKNTSHRGVEIK